MAILPTLVGYALFLLALLHAWIDGRDNRLQRNLLLLSLFGYGTLLELNGVQSGQYQYPREQFINLGVVPLSISLAWVGIIYSAILIAERLSLPAFTRIIATSLIALSLDWGMDPVASYIGAWEWQTGGPYFGVPGFNMVGWFFIPICFLLPYELGWDRVQRKLRFMTVQEVDQDSSWLRRFYSLTLVLPISLALLIIISRVLVQVVPFLIDPPLLFMTSWAAITIALAFILVIRRYTPGPRWADLLPSTILAFIALNYAFYALAADRLDLTVLMVMTGLPFWAVFIKSLLFLLRQPKRLTQLQSQADAQSPDLPSP